ncbi:hypothetical protein ASD44_05990 [Mesorhizobium sp. Root554]|nr:hypothetical protein ASD27_05995 [Mesorhizobium sp. Root1471]KQZ36184.1 hypothetical protein ASD44_05990 [Mesorhizobium sp. Root554]
MDRSIKFDNQTILQTTEISDIATNWNLSAEVRSRAGKITSKMFPKRLFRFGHRSTKLVSIGLRRQRYDF